MPRLRAEVERPTVPTPRVGAPPRIRPEVERPDLAQFLVPGARVRPDVQGRDDPDAADRPTQQQRRAPFTPLREVQGPAPSPRRDKDRGGGETVNVTIAEGAVQITVGGNADPRQIAALVEDKLDEASRQAASRVRGALYD